MKTLPALFIGYVVVAAAHTIWAAEGSQFRGANGNAVVADNPHPAAWGENQNVAWIRDVPGRGWANPLMLDGKVYVATAVPEPTGGWSKDEEGYSWQMHCIDLLSGDLDWKKIAKEGVPTIDTHRDNTYASESPVNDGQHIYVYFGMTGLYCFDKRGQIVWQKDLGSYPMRNGWGTSSSPAVDDGRLFVQVDNEQQSFLVALDAKTGDELWRVDRDEQSNWSSVVVWKNRVRTEVVTGGQRFRSYDPESGRLLWELDGNGNRASATPAGNLDLLIVGAEDRSSRGGGRGGIFAVRAGAQGDISPVAQGQLTDGLLWSTTDTSMGIASPLLYEGYVYIPARRGGIVHCFNARTGKLAYRERLRGGEFWASPWAAGGRVFLPDDRGNTFVLAPGKDFQQLGVNEIDGRLWATPTCAGGALVLRYEDRVVCVRASDGA